MANTGFKQAAIAYNVSVPGGVPLDRNNQPISESGLKQAIMLLEGTENPSPLLYEVVSYFPARAVLSGGNTVQYDPGDCPTGEMYILPDRLVFSPGGATVTVTLYSNGPWILLSSPTPALVTLSQTSGPSGFTYIDVTPTANEGQGPYVFQNTDTGNTVELYVINAIDLNAWILDTGEWDMLAFWFNNGIWNY